MRPRFQMLSKPIVERIVEEALHLLENIGVFVENHDALLLLKEAGTEVKDGRVFMKEDLVRSCLATAPSVTELFDRSGELAMTVGGDNVHFVPGSAGVYFRDSSGEIRLPITEDYVQLIKVTDYLPNIAAQSTSMFPSDVPADDADRYRLYLSLLHSGKPIVTGTLKKESFEPMKEMLVAVRGSELELRHKPLAIFDACPSPPLKWSDLTCQALIDSAKSGIPAELISMPLTGSVAPITLYGSVVQHVAESLSGVVIHQLANPNAPIIYGGSPAAFDMRCMTAPLGAIETLMIDSAYTQVGKRLGLPTHAYMGLSDAKDTDSQMGGEAAMGSILAALSGVNVVAGAGMLGSENCMDLGKLVIDNEFCGMALRLKRGIEPRDRGETEQIISECLKDGKFIEHPTTAQLFRTEQYIPNHNLIDRSDTGVQKPGEKKNLQARLTDEVERILRTHTPDPLDIDTEKELYKIWKCMPC